jgi:hypothetical protein
VKRIEDFLRRSLYKSLTDNTKGITERILTIRNEFKSVIASLSNSIKSLKSKNSPGLINTELRYYSNGRTTRNPAYISGEIFYLLCYNDGVRAEIVRLY